LSQLQALAPKKAAQSISRLTRKSRLFKTALNAILEKKGENIISLDLRKIPEAVADFFLICEASNSTQVKAIADFVQDEVKRSCGEIPHRHEGYQNAKWILVDYVNLIIHVMQKESRDFYQLEEMWSDGPLEYHKDNKQD
jgi:ribosome-associated protein